MVANLQKIRTESSLNLNWKQSKLQVDFGIFFGFVSFTIFNFNQTIAIILASLKYLL